MALRDPDGSQPRDPPRREPHELEHAAEEWLRAAEREVRADVFVFAVHTCQDPEAYNPKDVSQWEFHTLPASAVREHGGGSVVLPFLEAHGGRAVRWEELAVEVEAAYRLERSSGVVAPADDGSVVGE